MQRPRLRGIRNSGIPQRHFAHPSGEWAIMALTVCVVLHEKPSMSSTAAEGSAPVTAPAEPTVATTEAPAAPSSLTEKQETFNKEVREAKTPAELRSATEKLRNLNKPPVNADSKKPAAAEDDGKPAPAKKADEAPAAEETPAEPAAEEPAAEAETPAEPDEEPAEGDEADGPVTPSTAKKIRIRPREDDQVGRLAAAYLQRNRDMTWDEATAAARNQLGVQPEAATATPAAPKPNADLPQTVDAVDSATARLEEERTKAITDLRFEDSDKIDRQIRRLDRHRSDLVRQGEQARVQEQVQYDERFSQSEAQAAELYDFVSDAKSEGHKRMIEIEATMKATNDQTYYDPDKARIIAQMVGRELKIAPRRKGAAPAKAAAPATPVAPAAKKGILPSGGSRTTPASAATVQAETAKFEGIKNMGDLRKIQKELGIAG